MRIQMHPRQHAFHARALQDACGGPDRCLELLETTPFKMGRTRMYEARDPGAGVTMPIGAVEFLEGHQNWRLYSLTMARAHPAPTEAQCAASEAAEAAEIMMSIHGQLRRRGASSPFTEFEKRELEPMLIRAEGHIAGIRRAMEVRS